MIIIIIIIIIIILLYLNPSFSCYSHTLLALNTENNNKLRKLQTTKN